MSKSLKDQIIVRQMQPEDLDTVARIDQQSFSTPWSLNNYRYELLGNKLAHLWVAERRTTDDAHQIVGSLVAWVVLDEVHIATISVSPQYRRRHIASQLLTAALRETIAKGARIAHLEVRQSNQSAQSLYRSFGFSVVGRRPRYYQDNLEDAYLMTVADLGDKYLLWLNKGRVGPWQSPHLVSNADITQGTVQGKRRSHRET